MSADAGLPSPEGLQFDRVEVGQDGAPAPQAGPAVHCSACKAVLTSRYYAVNGAPVCARCRVVVDSAAEQAASKRLFARAALFGLGASILGAILYYGVIALTGLEIGIVAIVTGYLVGRAVRQGARGHGRRRFQVLAVVLTYFSVGLAYTPVAMKELVSHGAGQRAAHAAAPTARDSSSATDSTAAMPAGGVTQAGAPVPAPSRSKMKMLPALLLVIASIFLLPLVVIVASMPGGLLSALIIGIGMRQAWRMTGGRALQITGPFRIGDAPAAAPDPA